MVLKLSRIQSTFFPSFENDVKMYGTQAPEIQWSLLPLFENDVKMYGTQAGLVQ